MLGVQKIIAANNAKRCKIDILTTVLLVLLLISPEPSIAATPLGTGSGATFVNLPPVAGPDFATTNEDTPVSGNVLDNDHDPEGAPLHVVAASRATDHGHIDFRADGTFTYTPNPNFYGQDSFTYGVCDNSTPNACCTGTLCVTVLPVQDPPETLPDFFTVDEDTQLNGNVLDNDMEHDGEPITVVLGKSTQHGTIILNPDGTFIYHPDQDFNGTDTFTYFASDGIESSGETLVTITVVPVNDPPIAIDDEISTDEDVPVNIPVLSNDIDVDDILDVSMIVIVDLPVQGTLAMNPNTGTVTYTPNLNFNGDDSFTYKIKDPHGAESGIATVKITVIPVNDAPIATADFATTPEEEPVSIAVLLNDTDVDSAIDPSSIALASGPSHGTVVLESSTGEFIYTPEKDFNGDDSFTYTVKDIEGAISAPGTVTITVTPVNDAPVAVDDAATTLEDTAVDIPVLLNDYDVDNDVVVSSLSIATDPKHGTVSVNASTGVVTYTPDADFLGNDSFTYTIQDPEGLISLPATVTISVTAVNQPPVAVDDAVVLESLLPVTIDVLANDYDPDNDHDELSIVSVTAPSRGTVKIVDGKIVYEPEGNTSGTVTFTYTITDPDGLTDTAVVTIEYVFKEIEVSQGFSPNGDGNNDTWFIKGIESYPNNIVKVYNRWGLLVFIKEHYENTYQPWNGRANTGQDSGKLLDKGTYFYIVDPGGGLKALSGYVVIVR